MSKLNLNTPFVGLDDKPVADMTLGKILANQLYSAKGDDANQSFKMFDWAVELNKGNEISLDKTDSEMLYKVVEKLPLANASLVPILRAIKEVKESFNDKPSKK